MTTLTTALARPRLLFAPGPARRGFLLGFFAALGLCLMVLIGASGGVALSHSERVMPGISVAGVPLGGLNRAEATARLEAQLPSLRGGSLTLHGDGALIDVAFTRLGVTYDLASTVDAAFGIARSGNPFADGVARLRSLANPTAISGLALTYDGDALGALVRDIAIRFDRSPVEGAVTLGSHATFVVTHGVDGLDVDQASLTQLLAAALANPATLHPAVEVPIIHSPPDVSTSEATLAAAAAFRMSASPLALTGGGRHLSLGRAALAGAVVFGPSEDGSWGATVDSESIRRALRPVAAAVNREPRDASFIYGPDGVVGVVAGERGRELKVNATVGKILAALEQRVAFSPTPTATLAIGVVNPTVSTGEAKRVAPVMRPLSSWTTYYVPGDGNFWGANISIPAQDINGMVIAPGEWFEFWQDIGPVTLEHGYGYGGAIIGGRSVANGALGGGICSTSTTLFNAAMRAGLEIGERTNHSYYIERYPVGLDATVLKTDTWETDMTFRNDTAHPVVIRSYTGYGFVRFDIWGVPDGRTVTLSRPATSNFGTAIETTVYNPNLAPGTSLRVEYPHNGFDAVVTRWVRDADGNLLHENTWYSHYRTVNGITEVGPKKSAT
jgi:vancomycin resistance protein YoaR